jgi:hypothetical protein
MKFPTPASRILALTTFFIASLFSIAIAFADANPTATINQASAQDPTNATSIVFTAVFSEAVISFVNTDVTIGGTAGATTAAVNSGDGITWTITITGMTGSGTVTASIASGVCTNAATEPNNASTSTDNVVTFDNIFPGVTLNKKTGQADPTGTSPVLFSVVFSEPINVSTFTAGDINLTASTTGGTLTPTITQVAPMNGTTFDVSVAITGGAATGDVIASINASAAQDVAGNNNNASTHTDNIIHYDITGPLVTVNKKTGQADPTGAGPILFTVVFNEPISGASFTSADINLSASTTGGILTPTVTEIAPLDQTTFEVSVAITGSPVSGNIVASIDASGVQDLLGNNNAASTHTDNIVAYQLVPTVTSPTVAAVSENSADLGGNITSNGGSALTERGTVWKTSPGVTITDNKLAEGGTATGSFSHTRSSLPAGTEIFYRAYATNTVGTGLSAESSFFTFSITPNNQPASVVATAVSPTQIDLTFSAASSTGVNTDGYIILRRESADPATSSVQDGVEPNSLATGTSTLVTTITSLAQTTYSDIGLTPGTTYHYAVVPYNYNGTNNETYNYKVGTGFTMDSDITFSSSSDIVFASSGTTASIAYADFQDATTNDNQSNSITLADFTLRDGGSSNDADNKATHLTSLTISISNFANVRRVALFNDDTDTEIHGTEQNVTSGTVVFTPSLSIIAADDGDFNLNVRATFNSTVVDNQFIQITVTSATVNTSGSGFATLNAGGATTGGATNQIEVTASKLKFGAIPTGVLVSSPFSITVTAVDDPLENVDLDETRPVNPLEINPNPSGAMLTPSPVTGALVLGTQTFSNLSISPSGTYNLRAVHPLIDAQGLITISSDGVTVTPASPLTMCYNSAFQLLPPITITEGDPSDFAMGNNQIFSLVLPAGFVFNTAVNPTLTLTGIGIGSPVAATYVGNNIVRIGYSVTGTSNLNTIKIEDLWVKYIGTQNPTIGNILRYGGTAVQAGNSDADGKNHGTLTANSGTPPGGFDFTVQALSGNIAVDPNETSFNANDPDVKLIGNPLIMGNPANGSFNGNGVVLSQANGYVFSPSAVGPGSYVITFTHSESGGQGCTFTRSKTFNVSTSIIQNLNLQYCSNDPQTTNLSITQTDITNYFGIGFTFVEFVYWNPVTLKEYTIGPAVAPGLPIKPSNSIFNPRSPDFTPSYNFNWFNPRGVYIGYKVTNGTYTSIAWQYVRVPLAPIATFTIPQNVFCFDEASVILDGTPDYSANNANDFFINSGGNGVSFAGGNWLFIPNTVAGASSASQTRDLSYVYTAPGTGCRDTSAIQSITVHPRPGQVPPSDITSTVTVKTCEDGGTVTFTTNNATWANTEYKWYANSSLTNLISTGKSFSPAITSPPAPLQLDVSVPGTTNFYVTRTINGCESILAPLTLNAVVDPPAIANAGSDYTICAGQQVIFSNFATIPSITGSISTGSWSAIPSGGQFMDAGNSPTTAFGAATKFIPSVSQIAAGSVRLVLTSNDPAGPCGPDVDEVFITINQSVTVNAGNDAVVCSGDIITLNGNITGGVTTGTWSRNGQGGLGDGNTTTIADPLTFYNPSNTELTSGSSITFTLTSDDPDGAGPCPVRDDNVIVKINQRARVNAGPDQELCDGDVIQLAAGALPNANSSATSYSWSGGLGGFTPSNSTGNAVYNPDPSEVGSIVELKLLSNDADGTGSTGPCPVEEDLVSIKINKIPAAPFADSPLLYCRGENIENLTAIGTNLRWYNDSGLSAFRAPGPSFATGEVSNTDKVVDYFVTQTEEGCQSAPKKVLIIVNPLPVAQFSEANYCLGDFTTFTDASTVTYNNSLTGSIVRWEWNFDDPFGTLSSGTDPVTVNTPVLDNTHGGNTTGTYNQPSHRFGTIGSYNVSLRVTTSDGCSSTTNSVALFNEARKIGPVPKADFSFSDVCDQDSTRFNYTGTVANQIDDWSWNFDDPSSGAENEEIINNPKHKFSAPRNYNISLTVKTDLNCENTITKPVSILPYITSFPYTESFEAATHGWVQEGLNINGESSWQWTVPNGAIINSAADGAQAWITRDNTLGTYFNNERSVLYAPCFDMTQLERPVLSMEYWNSTDPGIDGAYMEFYDANEAVPSWKRLGVVNDGLEWYNRAAIVGLSKQNNIGQDIAQIGWSGITSGWTSGKFNMDPFNQSTKLRLRIVFGSNADAGNFDGFALDNFKIETRNRVILAENFTSLKANNGDVNNQRFAAFKQANQAEVVKLQYHIGLPDADDIHKENPNDPNARAAFYGLTNSNAIVPRVFLDGESDNPGNFVSDFSWANLSYNKRSLVTSPVSLTINSLPADDDKLALSVTIKAENSITSGRLALFVAVIEKTVNGQEFVVRKLLPSAAGLPITLPLIKDQVVTITPGAWEISSIKDVNQIALLAFIQDLETRDVLQAAYNVNPTNLPSIVTGVEDPYAKTLSFYPIPSDDIFNIELPEPVKHETPIKLYDTFGKQVISTSLKIGDKSKTLSTKEFAAGVYLLEIESSKGIVRKKISIVHKN